MRSQWRSFHFIVHPQDLYRQKHVTVTKDSNTKINRTFWKLAASPHFPTLIYLWISHFVIYLRYAVTQSYSSFTKHHSEESFHVMPIQKGLGEMNRVGSTVRVVYM